MHCSGTLSSPLWLAFRTELAAGKRSTALLIVDGHHHPGGSDQGAVPALVRSGS